MEYQVTFYRTVEGDKPVAEFLSTLKIRNYALHNLVTAGIQKLKHRESHGRPLTAAVRGSQSMMELRVGRTDIARVFFFFRPNREIVCTNGYVKKADKLDPEEVARAERYKADWERRYPSQGGAGVHHDAGYRPRCAGRASTRRHRRLRRDVQRGGAARPGSRGGGHRHRDPSAPGARAPRAEPNRGCQVGGPPAAGGQPIRAPRYQSSARNDPGVPRCPGLCAGAQSGRSRHRRNGGNGRAATTAAEGVRPSAASSARSAPTRSRPTSSPCRACLTAEDKRGVARWRGHAPEE